MKTMRKLNSFSISPYTKKALLALIVVLLLSSTVASQTSGIPDSYQDYSDGSITIDLKERQGTIKAIFITISGELTRDIREVLIDNYDNSSNHPHGNDDGVLNESEVGIWKYEIDCEVTNNAVVLPGGYLTKAIHLFNLNLDMDMLGLIGTNNTSTATITMKWAVESIKTGGTYSEKNLVDSFLAWKSFSDSPDYNGVSVTITGIEDQLFSDDIMMLLVVIVVVIVVMITIPLLLKKREKGLSPEIGNDEIDDEIDDGIDDGIDDEEEEAKQTL